MALCERLCLDLTIIVKWPSATKEYSEIKGYLSKNNKMDEFNPWRILPDLYFVIPVNFAGTLGSSFA